MKSLIYGFVTLTVIIIGMNCAKSIADNTAEKVENKLNNRYNIEQQLNNN